MSILVKRPTLLSLLITGHIKIEASQHQQICLQSNLDNSVLDKPAAFLRDKRRNLYQNLEFCAQ